MENAFFQRWGEKRDHGYILTEFNAIKKKSSEDVSDFIKRFNKLYNNLPVEIKPPLVAAPVVFVRAFDSDFGFTLRERRSSTLDQIQTDAEENYTSKRKVEKHNRLWREERGKRGGSFHKWKIISRPEDR